MTLVAVPPFAYGREEMPKDTSFSSHLLDANGEKCAFIFQAPKTGTIDRVCFRTSTVTTSDTLDVRLETVNTSGNPSGTLWGTTTNAPQASLVSNTWYEVTLTAGASVAFGDYIALVIALPASGAVGVINIAALRLGTITQGRPYVDQFTASWSKFTSEHPLMAVRYSDATYPHVVGTSPYTTLTANTWLSTSTPDERGNKITVPFACKVAGLWSSSTGGNTGDFDLKLYDASNNVLGSKSVEGNLNSVSGGVYEDLFAAEVTLAAGAVVRATKTATESAVNVTALDMATASGLGSAAQLGSGVTHTQRTDAGAWTDTTDKHAAIGLIISALDDGVSSGGAGAYSYAT